MCTVPAVQRVPSGCPKSQTSGEKVEEVSLWPCVKEMRGPDETPPARPAQGDARCEFGTLAGSYAKENRLKDDSTTTWYINHISRG